MSATARPAAATRALIISALAALALAVLAFGCTVGSTDKLDLGEPTPDDPDVPEHRGDYSVSVSPPVQELTLGTSTEFVLELSSTSYTGVVDVSAAGLSPSWEVTFSPSSRVSLKEHESTRVTMNVLVPSDAAAGATALTISVDGELGVRQAVASVVVDNRLIVPIALGTDDGAHSFRAVTLRLGATVVFVNYDSALHRIHAGDGSAGFPHQEGPGMVPSPVAGMPGGSYTTNISAPGEYEFYCHEHLRSSGEGVFVVTAGVER